MIINLYHYIAAYLCIFYSQGPGRLCSSSLVLTGQGGRVLGLAWGQQLLWQLLAILTSASWQATMHVTGLMCQQKVPQQQGEGGRVYTCSCSSGPQAACSWSSNLLSLSSWNELLSAVRQTFFAQGICALWWEVGQHGSCTVLQTLSGTMQCDEDVTADRPHTKKCHLAIAAMQQSLSACRLCESSGTTSAAIHCHPARMLCRETPMTLALAR